MTVPIAGGSTYQYDASVPHLLSSGLAKLPLWARKLLLKKAIEGSIILLARTRGRWPRDVRTARNREGILHERWIQLIHKSQPYAKKIGYKAIWVNQGSKLRSNIQLFFGL